MRVRCEVCKKRFEQYELVEIAWKDYCVKCLEFERVAESLGVESKILSDFRKYGVTGGIPKPVGRHKVYKRFKDESKRGLYDVKKREQSND